MDQQALHQRSGRAVAVHRVGVVAVGSAKGATADDGPGRPALDLQAITVGRSQVLVETVFHQDDRARVEDSGFVVFHVKAAQGDQAGGVGRHDGGAVVQITVLDQPGRQRVEGDGAGGRFDVTEIDGGARASGVERAPGGRAVQWQE